MTKKASKKDDDNKNKPNNKPKDRNSTLNHGSFTIRYQTGVGLRNKMNAEGWFKGTIKNKKMIGKSADDLIDQWNQDNPDKPVK